jgi:hypothetical protein
MQEPCIQTKAAISERDRAATLINPHISERVTAMAKALRVSLLVLFLSCSAQAGWMQNGSPQPDPTPPPSTAPASGETSEGHIPNDELVLEIVLGVLDSVRALF